MALQLGDFDFQYEYVCSQALRILALQDTNLASPSYGCFHYSYWRDKTSEFPDSRFQEASATLALLSHKDLFSSKVSCSQNELLERAFAGWQAWHHQQHKDGSFDEWYKHEHGFAVTTFSLLANSLAVFFLGDISDQRARGQFETIAFRAAQWLLKREDLVKTNHEMAGAAALACAGKVLGSQQFMEGAADKFNKALKCQNSEGWFNEIAGADLGYCFVLLDYAMLYRYFSGDHSGIPAMKKLLEFVTPFVQANLTIPPEAGLCLNPYVSRLGTFLMADESEHAAALTHEFASRIVGFQGIEPYLVDDLRLCRWSHLPLVTNLLVKNRVAQGWTPDKLPTLKDVRNKGIVAMPKANIFSYSKEKVSVVVTPVGGPTVRVVDSRTDKVFSFEDHGYLYLKGSVPFTTVGYDQSRAVKVDDHTIQYEMGFSPAKFFYPGIISRIFLRLLGEIPGLHYWLRRGIDLYRKVMRTAVNQSSAPVASDRASMKLKRQVQISDSEVVITDILQDKNKQRVKLEFLKPIARVNEAKVSLSEFSMDVSPNAECFDLVFTKKIIFEQKGFKTAFSCRINNESK